MPWVSENVSPGFTKARPMPPRCDSWPGLSSRASHSPKAVAALPSLKILLQTATMCPDQVPPVCPGVKPFPVTSKRGSGQTSYLERKH